MGMKSSSDVAEKLRRALMAPGKSKQQLANATGMSRQAVYSWLQTGRIAKKHLPSICRYFGQPLAWLWDEDLFDAETLDFAREFSTLSAAERRRWQMALIRVRSKNAA